jgi:hypothetical protein
VDEESEGDTDTTSPLLSEVTSIITPSTNSTPKNHFSYYSTAKLHVSDSALPPLGFEAITFQY